MEHPIEQPKIFPYGTPLEDAVDMTEILRLALKDMDRRLRWLERKRKFVKDTLRLERIDTKKLRFKNELERLVIKIESETVVRRMFVRRLNKARQELKEMKNAIKAVKKANQRYNRAVKSGI